MFLEGPSSFLYFFCNDLIRKMHLDELALRVTLTSQDNRKVEHVKTGFYSSKFPPVITIAMIFSFTFPTFGGIVHSSSFLDAVVRCG